MKTTDYFKQTIAAYLEQRAADDELFATVFANPNKNIDDCITYILNTVKESGCNGFADEEIYSMAMHYYDEPDIEVGKKNGYASDCEPYYRANPRRTGTSTAGGYETRHE